MPFHDNSLLFFTKSLVIQIYDLEHDSRCERHTVLALKCFRRHMLLEICSKCEILLKCCPKCEKVWVRVNFVFMTSSVFKKKERSVGKITKKYLFRLSYVFKNESRNYTEKTHKSACEGSFRKVLSNRAI